MATQLLKTGVALFLCLTAVCLFRTEALGDMGPSDPLTIYYLERPPYFYTGEEGVPRGLIIERVKRVFDKAQVPYRLELLPTKRHLAYLRSREGRFCTIGWYKNSERERFAKYSAAIYQNKSRIALARSDNDKIQTGKRLEEVFSDRGLTLLVRDGYSYGAYIDEKIRSLQPQMHVLPFENVHMLNMIHSGRGDYLFTSEEEAEVMIANAGFWKTDFKYVRFPNLPSGLKRYILYNRSVDDALIRKVDLAIERYLR